MLSGLTFTRVLWCAGQALALFVLATFVFDTIHFVLHRLLNSRRPLLRAFGQPHQNHHVFYDYDLKLHDDIILRNMAWHVVPEYLTQMLMCACGLLVFDAVPVLLVMGFFTLAFALVLIDRGKDRHHIPFEVLPAAHEAFFIGGPYHALHHVYPDSYLGSYTMLFDRLIGTACQLRGRTVALTGASGAFGAGLKTLLERAGARVIPLKFGRDYTRDDLSGTDEALRSADILALCHGSKGEDAMWANCDSFVALIERFKALTHDRRFPPEVWAVGSEIECHPAVGSILQRYARSKRAFARYAARLLYDRDILYRHIVPSAFRSPMGPGLISGKTAARIALWHIRRGFRYVPVTYTGVAFVNAVPFLVRAIAAGRAPLTRRSSLTATTSAPTAAS